MNENDVKRTEALPEKKSQVKSALQQTYFVSLLCMVLCVAMFMGTSYAWFTSGVTSTDNEIYIGILDVGLYEQETVDGNITWKDLSATNATLFDSNVRWEPGYTMLETVQVVNKGDLAFKYVLSFTDGALEDDSTQILNDVAKYFDVWVYDHRENNNVVPAPASYAEITASGSGWVSAGSLDLLLNGKAVFHGEMEEVRKSGQNAGTVNAGTVDGLAKEATYTIALHMKEESVITLMGEVISLNVKLVGYQTASEKDGLGSNYDQMVVNEDELMEALANGGHVVLVSDIAVTKDMVVPEGVTTVLDLNGYVILRAAEEGANAITNRGTLTVYDNVGNGEIAMVYTGATSDGKAVNAIGNYGNLTINGANISNESQTANDQIGYAIDNHNGATLTVNGGEITASGSGYYDGIRLFCGDKETVVTVNGGEISTIRAQNPTKDKASEVKGTIVINGGTIGTTYYENYTTVKVAETGTTTVTPYGNGEENTTSVVEGDYRIYSFMR